MTSIGGTLGFHCRHAYAHTDDDCAAALPFALKGVDVIVYTVFRSLGLVVSVRPVLELGGDGDDEEGEEEESGDLIATGLHGLQISSDSRDLIGNSSLIARLT